MNISYVLEDTVHCISDGIDYLTGDDHRERGIVEATARVTGLALAIITAGSAVKYGPKNTAKSIAKITAGLAVGTTSLIVQTISLCHQIEREQTDIEREQTDIEREQTDIEREQTDIERAQTDIERSNR